MLFVIIPLALVAAVLGAAGLVFLMFFNLWLQAKASDVPISMLDMLFMRLRAVDPAAVVRATVALAKAGLHVSPADLETHILAGGNMSAVAEALISASKAELDMDFKRLAAIDLAGRDVVAAVAARVNPKVVLCPVRGSGQHMITGVAQDGVRVGVKARVTVRTQLSRLVGGAGEETIVARVGEGIVAAIGRARTHREILESPDTISSYILARGLDSGTCFEILSVDIADVDVLDNIGARLQSSQADADKRIAQAQAEMRRAAAVAAHHEMTARTTRMQSRVVTARSTVPLALSSALAEANLGRTRPLRTFINTRLRWRALGDG